MSDNNIFKEHNEKEHWADHVAKKIVEERGDLPLYTIAAGITPSGVVHIGNFREIITVDLVGKALKKLGKNVRFIYSWDDYDVFRKVPANFPKKDLLEKYLRQPIVDVPDPFGCHSSFAEHNEFAVENELPVLNVFPEFLYQAKKYRACTYAEGIKKALENRLLIKSILDAWRKEPLPDSWTPVRIFCAKCNTDRTSVIGYDGDYSLEYSCECGFRESFDFRKKGIVKLQWRVDWPMRWHFEKVVFEPSGKEHSSAGGSNTTAEEIVRKVWGFEPPVHLMYEFISIKGSGGKMSSSKGNTVDLKEMLSIYEPSIIRFLFVRTIPSKSFEVSFDADVLTIYDSFDRLERVYFGVDEAVGQPLELQKRIYELSAVEVPGALPYQPSFRHITTILQLNLFDEQKTFDYFKSNVKTKFDEKRLLTRISCAKNWLKNYAPEQFIFRVQDSPSKAAFELDNVLKVALKDFAYSINDSLSEFELAEQFKLVANKHKVGVKDLFKASYVLLLDKERGPKLFSLLKSVGVQKFRFLVDSLEDREKVVEEASVFGGIEDLNKLVSFEVSSELKRKFPSFRLGVIVVDNVKSNASVSSVVELLRSQEDFVRRLFENKSLSSFESFDVWRKAFSSFGAKPKKYKSSVEALVKRVLKGDSVPSINCIVDLCNFVSLKYLVPVGANDLEKVEGKIVLGFASGSERFVMIGSKEVDPPIEGEVVYMDSKDVLCRRWNWRECDKTKVSESVKKVIVYLESLNPKDDLEAALSELSSLIQKHCGAKTSCFLIE